LQDFHGVTLFDGANPLGVGGLLSVVRGILKWNNSQQLHIVSTCHVSIFQLADMKYKKKKYAALNN
jgi:hypothetical protein